MDMRHGLLRTSRSRKPKTPKRSHFSAKNGSFSVFFGSSRYIFSCKHEKHIYLTLVSSYTILNIKQRYLYVFSSFRGLPCPIRYRHLYTGLFSGPDMPRPPGPPRTYRAHWTYRTHRTYRAHRRPDIPGRTVRLFCAAPGRNNRKHFDL